MSEVSPYAPRWLQIVETLRARIADGTYPVGSKLPSETDLMKEFGVSRPTVQRAMQDMAARGEAKREHGVGSFVLPPASSATREQNRPALAILDHTQPNARMVDVELAGAPAFVAEQLGVVEGARVHLRRFVSMFDEIPSELVALWTPVDVAKAAGLDRPGPLTVAVRRLLNGAGERLAHVNETLTAVPASAEEAGLLGVPEGAALISVLASIVDATGRTVMVVEVLLPGSLHQLEDSYAL